MVVHNTRALGVELARETLTWLLRVTPNVMSKLSSNVIAKLTLVIDEIDKIEVENGIVTVYCKIDGNSVVVSISDEIKIKTKGE